MKLRFVYSSSVALFLADCAALFVSCAAAFILRFATGTGMAPSLYMATLPWLTVFPLLYLVMGLYPGSFIRRHEELKRLSIATSAGFMALAFFSFMIKEGQAYSRLALLLAWAFTLLSVPLARYAVRRYGSRFAWWSLPCVMFGNSHRIPELYAALAESRMLGVRPAALVLDENDPAPALDGLEKTLALKRLPLGDAKLLREGLHAVAAEYPGAYAVASFDASDAEKRQEWLAAIDQSFQRIIIIPDISVGGRVWVSAVAIGRLAGIMLRQNLLDPKRMLIKRCIDVAATLAAGGIIFPLLLVLGIAVRADSPGPAFFRQRRIGRNGNHFMVYKFRTMAVNAAELLEKHLAENPEARREWAETQKLKNDPRITRVGKFLRKTSLDELPQLLNVLMGDMSLVGPRPIVDNEIERYGDDYALYTRVRPGITGLWQVSGRNDLSYADRVWLDRHYVCNWSVWLDILIIIRTVPEVLHCSGAY